MKESDTKAKAYLFLLALCLFAAPFTFSFPYQQMVGDILAASILVVSILIMSRRCPFILFFVVLTLGGWVSISPSFLSKGSLAAYINNSILGFILMALAFHLKGCKEGRQDLTPSTPVGWSLNPSQAVARIATVALAALCFLLTRYQQALNAGFAANIWNIVLPITAPKTASLWKPIDIAFDLCAGIAPLYFSLIIVLGLHGGGQRWRTMPWVGLLYGFLVVVIGVAAAALCVIKPLFAKGFSLIDILIAFQLIVMTMLTAPEFICIIDQLLGRKNKGISALTLLFNGLPIAAAISRDSKRLGITPTWTLVVTALLAIWTFLSAWYHRSSFHEGWINTIAGPYIFIISILSFAEILRSVRLINILIALFLLLGPWLCDGGHLNLIYMNSLVSILIILLSLPKGKIQSRYGTIDKMII